MRIAALIAGIAGLSITAFPLSEALAQSQRSRLFSPNQALLATTEFLAHLNVTDISDYSSDLPQKFPAEFRAVRSIMTQQMLHHSWISGLNGVATPMKKFTYDGSTYYFGIVCKPSDCDRNNFRFYVREGGGRAFALLTSLDILGAYRDQIRSAHYGRITEEGYHITIESLSWD